jgi:hypothetical protein
MTDVAMALNGVLGPVDAVGVLLGAAVGILADTFGDEAAADWLRKTADEIENDEGVKYAGRA